MTRVRDKRESRRIENEEPRKAPSPAGYLLPRGSTSDPRLRAYLRSEEENAPARDASREDVDEPAE